MPCTTTQKTIGATIIEISLRKASLKNFKPTANPGASIAERNAEDEAYDHLNEQRFVERRPGRGSDGYGCHGA